MNDHDRQQSRAIDKWLRWTAIVGPVIGFFLGNCSGAIITYQAISNDRFMMAGIIKHQEVLDGWKDKQEDFNRNILAAIARLKALVKDMQP